MKRPAITAVAGLALLVSLAACGKQSDLERPGPMWGPQEKAERAAQQRAQAAAATNSTAANKAAPNQNPALQPYVNPAPARDVPIPGERTYPSGAPQTGGQ